MTAIWIVLQAIGCVYVGVCGLAIVVVGTLIGVAEVRAVVRRRRRGGSLPDDLFRQIGGV